MKQILAILIGLAMSTAVFAQFKKGTMMVGGGFSATFNKDKTKSGSTTVTNGTVNSISMFPQAGYFIMDNLAVGAGVDMSSTTSKAQGSNNKSTSTSVSLAPFARYYYQKFYGQFAFNLGTGNFKDTFGSTTTDNKYSTAGWNMAVGYAILLNEHVAVEPQLGYGSTSEKYKAVGTVPSYTDSQSGLFVRIGLQIYLSKFGK